jgi:hypothetical protein
MRLSNNKLGEILHRATANLPRDSKHDHDSVRVRWRPRSSVIALSAFSCASTSYACGNRSCRPGNYHELLIGIAAPAASASELAGFAYTIDGGRFGHGSPCCPDSNPIATRLTRIVLQSWGPCDAVVRKEAQGHRTPDVHHRSCHELCGDSS